MLCKISEQSTFKKLREHINLSSEIKFKNLDYNKFDEKTGEIVDIEKKEKFKSGFVGFHALRIVVEKTFSKIYWQNLSRDINLLDEIATLFSYHKSNTKIQEELERLSFSTLTKNEKGLLIEALVLNIHFDKFLNLSLKAIHKLLPFMRDGFRYDESVEKVGYKREEGEKKRLLRALNKDEMRELTNPVVKRAIAQTRKVINALIREYGQFDKVHVELTREIKKSYNDRKDIQKGQEKYQEVKLGIVHKFIEDYGREPKGKELLKFRLLREQDYRCIYSDIKISPEQLLVDKFVEIDHILPFSRSLEDGMHNKVVCLSKENQDKKDMTPYEYFNSTQRDWHSFEERVKGLKTIKKAKRVRLLKKNFDENSSKEFRERNINDTAFMARFIKNFIDMNLELTSKSKKRVVAISGTLTSMLRHSWAVGAKSRENHLHHAVDAIIVAFATDSEVQRLSTLSAKKEGFTYTKSEQKAGKLRFTSPMENFRDLVQESIDDIFVSFAPRRGVSGAAHKDTIHSKKTKKTKRWF